MSAKYRPVLTAQQIQQLILLCKADATPESVSCLRVLVPFEFKIQNQLVTAAYTSSPQQTTLASLGGEEEPVASKEERWAAAYKKWCIDWRTCSVQEIADAQEHRYLHGLMTADEAAAFEEGLL